MMLLAFFCQCLACASQMLLKLSARRKYDTKWKEYLNPFVMGGYALLGICLLLMLVCYRYLGYMQTVTIEPAGYVLVFLAGIVFFRERFTGKRFLGMLLILCGILLFHLG